MSKITPCLWFDGKAEEAARFYVSLLPDSRIDAVLPYTVETPGGKPGNMMLVEFTLAGESYMALNGGPYFQFTPAISLFVSCADQAEVDRLWNVLLDGGTPLECGWVTDRYGVSWQIVPAVLSAMMKDKDAAKVRRVTEAMLQMVKLDVDQLEKAFNGA
ncbi:putative 3-demethylubiquinone-9 3-methyltransferase (glyoxalase superfamily) [Microvirga lupini]|uniref:Putative 3-demethylubiquinone-9 3-methyltransferase (Glyoxalase superfamily) n=1 Tax=Microvirga lupini TaxID=420324 RepID=A0A7W4YYK2_9HYPH|nr:VOC family protein [Microvirga lupini]MBB3020108.1 putative 3-demethylubiquinone-9 3-methyltransferase (glyoxalase superfamily) [Microvirga lupini]